MKLFYLNQLKREINLENSSWFYWNNPNLDLFWIFFSLNLVVFCPEDQDYRKKRGWTTKYFWKYFIYMCRCTYMYFIQRLVSTTFPSEAAKTKLLKNKSDIKCVSNFIWSSYSSLYCTHLIRLKCAMCGFFFACVFRLLFFYAQFWHNYLSLIYWPENSAFRLTHWMLRNDNWLETHNSIIDFFAHTKWRSFYRSFVLQRLLLFFRHRRFDPLTIEIRHFTTQFQLKNDNF